MKIKSVAIHGLLLMLLFTNRLAAQVYAPSDKGSSVKFVIRNFGLNVEGSFTNLKGTIIFDPANLPASSFNVSVAAATVNTGNNTRDSHLKKAEYFDAQITDAGLGEFSHRAVLARFDNLDVLGVYFPPDERKRSLFEFVIRHSADWLARSMVITGDFNTGRPEVDTQGTPFVCADKFEEMLGLGWVDAWRRINPEAREYTWYSHAENGFRLDHALLSPPLAKHVAAISYSHSERIAKVSDHSALIIDLKIPASGIA